MTITATATTTTTTTGHIPYNGCRQPVSSSGDVGKNRSMNHSIGRRTRSPLFYESFHVIHVSITRIWFTSKVARYEAMTATKMLGRGSKSVGEVIEGRTPINRLEHLKVVFTVAELKEQRRRKGLDP